MWYINNVPKRYTKVLWQGNEEVSQTVVKAIKQTQCSLMKPTKVSDKHTWLVKGVCKVGRWYRDDTAPCHIKLYRDSSTSNGKRGYIMMKIKNRNTGKTYDCIAQAIDLNFDGNYSLRYNIGIENYQGFNSIHCIYDNDTFNKMYEVIS